MMHLCEVSDDVSGAPLESFHSSLAAEPTPVQSLSHRLRRDPLDEAGSGTRVLRVVDEVLG